MKERTLIYRYFASQIHYTKRVVDIREDFDKSLVMWADKKKEKVVKIWGPKRHGREINDIDFIAEEKDITCKYIDTCKYIYIGKIPIINKDCYIGKCEDRKIRDILNFKSFVDEVKKKPKFGYRRLWICDKK